MNEQHFISFSVLIKIIHDTPLWRADRNGAVSVCQQHFTGIEVIIARCLHFGCVEMGLTQCIILNSFWSVGNGILELADAGWRIDMIQNGIYPRESLGAHDLLFIERAVSLPELRMSL